MSISVGNAAEMSAPTPIQAVKRQESGDMERADMYKHIRRHRAGRNRSREFASPRIILDRLRGWACEIRTQKCRRKLSL
jgi:hypothetical protein